MQKGIEAFQRAIERLTKEVQDRARKDKQIQDLIEHDIKQKKPTTNTQAMPNNPFLPSTVNKSSPWGSMTTSSPIAPSFLTTQQINPTGFMVPTQSVQIPPQTLVSAQNTEISFEALSPDTQDKIRQRVIEIMQEIARS